MLRASRRRWYRPIRPGVIDVSGGRALAMDRDQIEALVAKERPGWRVVDFIEVNDESGPSFEVTIESGGRQVVLLLGEDEGIAGEGR
jgi:hypothetical protein